MAWVYLGRMAVSPRGWGSRGLARVCSQSLQGGSSQSLVNSSSVRLPADVMDSGPRLTHRDASSGLNKADPPGACQSAAYVGSRVKGKLAGMRRPGEVPTPLCSAYEIVVRLVGQ